jgi:hypothetical protein
MARLKHDQRSSGAPPLAALLTADRFRLGRRTARVQGNLRLHGGAADPRAAAWVGDDLPPLGAPSITLGAARGTLGPHSFGFLDNRRAIAPYAAALPARPRPGPVALVCARRDALPDVAPLAVARGLGVAWIISVGDGDAAEVLRFLSTDELTRAVLLAAPADPAAALELGKPLCLLGGDPLLRAAVRRAGGSAVDHFEDWLARGALLDLGLAAPSRPRALVAGGGAALLAEAARAAGLALPITALPDDDPDDLAAALAHVAPADLLLLAGAAPGDALPAGGDPLPPILPIDLGQPERVRALLRALAAPPLPAAPPSPARDHDRAAAQAILEAAVAELGDHDAKRLLKAWGLRVSRQAPANSATAAARVAAQIGYPVDLVAGESVRRAAAPAELRRHAALLLESAPYVLVREAFPAAPRARLTVRRGPGLGPIARVASPAGDERALLPLAPADALLLARVAGAEDPGALADLLATACAAAAEHRLSLDLELFVGRPPAIVAASAHR